MTYCLLFPGQGAQHPEMLNAIKNLEIFKSYYATACEVLQQDLLADLSKHVNRNLISSALVTLSSAVSMQIYLEQRQELPAFVSGYSVGQWTSLYAAGVVDFKQLIEIVTKRAGFMDACINKYPSGMIAVIGVNETCLTEFCALLTEQGFPIAISNFNCPGQYSLAGTEAAVQEALQRLESLQPKKFVRIPVSGAWHSALLAEASQNFAAYLETVDLQTPKVPIIDNVSGQFMPQDMKPCLAKHLSYPVLWEKGIRHLIQAQCQQFIEIGYGTTLTKFGFFIDRSVSHQAYYCEALLQEAVKCAG